MMLPVPTGILLTLIRLSFRFYVSGLRSSPYSPENLKRDNIFLPSFFCLLSISRPRSLLELAEAVMGTSARHRPIEACHTTSFRNEPSVSPRHNFFR